MSKLKGFSLFVMVFLCLIATQSLRSQDFSIKIYASDGSGWIDSVNIGKFATATFGIDAGLGETELPPVPPQGPNQAPDVRSVDPTGGAAFGQGLAKDLRTRVNNFQRDIYKITFRRSDPEGSAITLSWQAGLGSVGGGGWYLIDQTQIAAIFPNVDMSAQTSFTHASFNGLGGSTVYIVAGDGRQYRTFSRNDLVTAADSKAKVGKSEKRKAVGSEGCFTFLNDGGATADELYVEWSQVITSHNSYGNFDNTPTPVDPVKPAKITYNGGTVNNASSTTICLRGNKGKELITKKWYYKAAGAPITALKPPLKTPDGGTSRLTYNRPNANNVGEEIFAQGAFDPVNGLTVGSDAVKKVIHPKWKSVMTSLVKHGKAGDILPNGTPYCLDIIGSKPVTKIMKATAPDKFVRYKGSLDYGNRLMAELIVLKVNIAMSTTGKTATQFGSLTFNDPNDPTNPYNGKTISQISGYADQSLSCDSVGGQLGSYTRGDVADLLARLNGEFSGLFDTTSFGTGKTVTKGVKSIALVDYLTPTASEEPVAYTGNFSELYDVPKDFQLSQNYPNPFNPTTQIDFTLPSDGFVTLKVYNMLGQEVATLLNREEMSEGDNTVEFNAAALSTGVYYYRLVVNDGELQQVKKMMLMK